jgi:hypothetical protein
MNISLTPGSAFLRQQHRTVLAHRAQHHRVAEFGRDLAQDVDAFDFETIDV